MPLVEPSLATVNWARISPPMPAAAIDAGGTNFSAFRTFTSESLSVDWAATAEMKSRVVRTTNAVCMRVRIFICTYASKFSASVVSGAGLVLLLHHHLIGGLFFCFVGG